MSGFNVTKTIVKLLCFVCADLTLSSCLAQTTPWEHTQAVLCLLLPMSGSTPNPPSPATATNTACNCPWTFSKHFQSILKVRPSLGHLCLFFLKIRHCIFLSGSVHVDLGSKRATPPPRPYIFFDGIFSGENDMSRSWFEQQQTLEGRRVERVSSAVTGAGSHVTLVLLSSLCAFPLLPPASRDQTVQDLSTPRFQSVSDWFMGNLNSSDSKWLEGECPKHIFNATWRFLVSAA